MGEYDMMSRHRTRHLVMLVGLIIALFGLAVPASATGSPPDPAPRGPQPPVEEDIEGPDNIVTGTASVSRDGGSRRGIQVTVDGFVRTESGEKPAAGRRNVFLFDSSIRLNPEAFPTCARSVIEQQGPQACPEGSRIGSGRAEIYPTGAVVESVVFNTRYPNGARGMLITFLTTGGIFENTFEPVSRPYRPDFAWAADEIIQPNAIPPEDRTASSRFQLTLGATYRGQSFLESAAPAGSRLTLGYWTQTVTGQVILLTVQAPRP